jgi:hypothetical protein
LKNLDLPSPVASALNTILKGALSQAHSATLFKDELHKTQAAQNAREQKCQRSRRVIKKGGPPYTEEARRMVQQREKDEIYEMQLLLERKLEREHTAIRNRFKRILGPAIRRSGKASVGLRGSHVNSRYCDQSLD